MGVDNLHVVRHVGRLLDGVQPSRSLELEDDGDLLGQIRKMISSRVLGRSAFPRYNVMRMRMCFVKVRELDRDRNNRAIGRDVIHVSGCVWAVVPSCSGAA